MLVLTIFDLLEITRLDKLRFDCFEPPEQFCYEHHHVVLYREQKHTF